MAVYESERRGERMSLPLAERQSPLKLGYEEGRIQYPEGSCPEY